MTTFFFAFALAFVTLCIMEIAFAHGGSGSSSKGSKGESKKCFAFDIYTPVSDRNDGFNQTNFGGIANVPFYDADTDGQLSSIQFTQTSLPPGDCYITSGIFSFQGSNQLTYMFTSCNGFGSSDMITGGGGEYVGAYGTNSFVSFNQGEGRFDFRMEFCIPPEHQCW